MRDRILEEIKDKKIIAIIRGVSSANMEKTIRALLDGGICLAEITFDHRSKEGRAETLRSLELIRDKFQGQIFLGAGTVLSPRDVEDAKRAGAEYIISPNVDEKVIYKTREMEMVSMPGAFTPSEVVNAYEAGADVVKLYPAALMGIPYIKALRAPLAHIPMSAVGGVTPDSVPDFLKAGVSCFGIGGNLVDAEKIGKGEFASITETAGLFSRAAAMG